MKKIAYIIVFTLLIPAAAAAGEFKSSLATVPYNSASYSIHVMKMPTAGSMAKESAKQGAINRGGGIRFTNPSGWESGGSIANQAIDAATTTATETAAAGAMGAVMESKIKKMAGDMAMATLKKKGSPYAEIMITMMKGGSASAAGAGQYQGTRGGSSGGSGCKVMEQSRQSWGGKSASLTTSRCPAGSGEYQWMSSVSRSGGGGNYFMTAMYTGTASTLDEFNRIVGSDMKSMIRNTRWK